MSKKRRKMLKPPLNIRLRQSRRYKLQHSMNKRRNSTLKLQHNTNRKPSNIRRRPASRR